MLIIIILSILPLAACVATPPANVAYITAAATPANPQAAALMATAQTAALQETAVAQSVIATNQAATAQANQAATATRQAQLDTQTATTAAVILRVTEQALSAGATRDSIVLGATATAAAHMALVEQRLIDDEATRLALQRAAEQEQIAHQRAMNRLRPLLWAGLALAGVILASGGAYWLIQRSRPYIFDDSDGPRVLVPAGQYQVLDRPRPALPATVGAPTPTNPVELPPLARGHVLIAGETGSGKTTAMTAVLRRRQNVIVLDPHDDGRTWGPARVIGGGRDFEAIGEYMAAMEALLGQRYDQRAHGSAQFEPLTVATDEMPAIVAAVGRRIETVWRQWLREGRKVGLYFVVSTQSTRVKTLGIRGEGDLLENFQAVIALGKLAQRQYPDMAAGLEWPAVIYTAGGAAPVLIPSPAAADGPLFIAPTPGYADPGRLTAAVRERIRQLAAELPSRRAVEERVFGYTGGAAYEAVKEVLNGAG